MQQTIEAHVDQSTYSILEGTGDTIYITPTSDWVKTLHRELHNDFVTRLDELQEMAASGIDYAEDSWDDYDSVKYYLKLLKDPSCNESTLADAWTFSTLGCWVKVVNNDSGEIVCEAYGNGF